jgi:DNA-binding NtrC family response regulator
VRFRKPVTQLSPDALEALVNYAWPGNIRELENVVERCVLLSDGDTIRLRDLAPEVRAAAPGAAGGDEDDDGDESATGAGGLKEQVREATVRLEREMIVRALAQTGHNVTQTARLLKISRKSLQIKMKELGLRETT